MHTRTLRRAALFAVLVPVLLGARGDRSFDGHVLKDRSPKRTESAVLRADADTWRGYEARTGLWVIVAESREDWDRAVAPGLAKALGRGGSPAEFERFADSLGGGIDVQGPNLEGALVRVDLPDGRGRAYASVHLPQLIQRGGESSLLNTRRPNVGLFLSGADIKRQDDDDIDSFYIASRPKDLARGALPTVETRGLPGKGRGDLAIFGGRGASEDDGDDLRSELKRWVGPDELQAGAMRTFPKKGVLSDILKTIRVEVEHPEPDEGWYRTLSWKPSKWDWSSASQRMPTRYLTQAIPVVVDEGRSRREVIVGVVAFYSQLFVTPLQAAAHVGDGRRFFEAVHDGELPFFRVGDDVLFYRAHLDRWLEGDETRGRGKARKYKSAVRRAEAWADQARERNIDKALRRPFPFRMDPIPDEELEEIVDSRRRMRGRIFDDDLNEWLSHQGKGLPDGPSPVYVLGRRPELAEVRASFASGGSAVASYDGPQSDRRAEREDREPGELRKAPRPAGMDDEEILIEDEDDAAVDYDPFADIPQEDEDEDEGDFDELDGEPDYAPATTADKRIEIYDFFVSGACRAGATQTAVVDLLYDGPGEGEVGSIALEWDFFLADRIVANDVLEFYRESGSMELEFDLECPITVGKGRLEVLVRTARGTCRPSRRPRSR